MRGSRAVSTRTAPPPAAAGGPHGRWRRSCKPEEAQSRQAFSRDSRPRGMGARPRSGSRMRKRNDDREVRSRNDDRGPAGGTRYGSGLAPTRRHPMHRCACPVRVVREPSW